MKRKYRVIKNYEGKFIAQHAIENAKLYGLEEVWIAIREFPWSHQDPSPCNTLEEAIASIKKDKAAQAEYERKQAIEIVHTEN